MLKLKNVTSWK